MRPVDECPYRRPFPADFEDCPAYQPVRFIGLSSDYRPMAPVRTCRHLVSRRAQGEDGRWYAACSLGDAAARRAWVASVDPTRLNAIAHLRRQMGEVNAAFIDQLWMLKGEQLQARRDQLDTALLEQRMRQVGRQFVEQTQAFLQTQHEALQEIDVTMEAILELLRVSVERLIVRASAEVRWEVPEEVLARFSPPVRLFFRPPGSEVRAPAAID